MYAYDDTLIYKARLCMARMLDYAVYGLNMPLKDFYQLFLDSSFSDKFAAGDSSTIAGKSGPEIAYAVLKEKGYDIEYKEPEYVIDRSPEYWTGWALSYYQWYRNVSFNQINDGVSISDIIIMYDKYHEMDIDKFVIEMDRRRGVAFSDSALKRIRTYARLSQSELARKAEVPVRTIQQYEQKQKDIKSAKIDTVIRLAKALRCDVEDLMN